MSKLDLSFQRGGKMSVSLRSGAAVIIIGAAALSAVLGTSGANAAPSATKSIAAPPVAEPGESCWYAIDTGKSLCVADGEDLVAAVARDEGVQLVFPAGTELSGAAAPTAHARTTASPAATQASVAISTIYDDANYGGPSYTMSTSKNCDASAWGFSDISGIGWYNRVSSFKSYSGCKTAVFEKVNYGGSQYGYFVNASNLGAMNDKAKAWRASK